MFSLWQWVWGLIQSLAGLIIYLSNSDKPHFTFHGACVCLWKKRESLSLGKFIFLSDKLISGDDEHKELKRILLHEYGHCIQSLVLGPLYLIVVGIPSLIWCQSSLCKSIRSKKELDYYSFFCERNADFLGSRILRKTDFDISLVKGEHV